MIDEITFSSGQTVRVGRIEREKIDSFNASNPEPEPPRKSAADLGIEVFGGIEETEFLTVLDDPEYLAALDDYHVSMAAKWLDLFASVVDFDFPAAEADDLAEMGIIDPDSPADILDTLIIRSREDTAELIAAILYNSTVTVRGLREASEKFNIRWRGKRLSALHKLSVTPVDGSDVFGARQAARANGISWLEFCKLTGPEQSDEVAFHLLDGRLEWLITQWNRVKAQ